MTSKFVDVDIRQDEGFRGDAYPDPLTGGEPWTVGFGCTGSGIGPTTRWTLAQAVAEQMKRRQEIERALDQAIGWWRDMNDERQDVLVNMAYNLGVPGLLAFHHTLQAAESGDYTTAAAGMLASKWATQVPKRAKRLAQQMLTGARAVPLSNFGQAATQAAIGNG
jgi:lysozyme